MYLSSGWEKLLAVVKGNFYLVEIALIISRLTWLPVVWMEHTTFWMFYQMLIGLKISNILLFTEAFANVNRGLRKKRKKKQNPKTKNEDADLY